MAGDDLSTDRPYGHIVTTEDPTADGPTIATALQHALPERNGGRCPNSRLRIGGNGGSARFFFDGVTR